MPGWIKRLRIFAGPNGSGKSTLYDYLIQIRAFHPYYHINPDIIANDLSVSFNLDNWPFGFSFDELKRYIDASGFQKLVSGKLSTMLGCESRRIFLEAPSSATISYLAAAVADFLRMKMLDSGSSFSFESVFSHHSKLNELTQAKKMGFKLYLYFITTSNPIINLQRVQNRVQSGGHDVPGEKLTERYSRTMRNLYALFTLSDRAYLFDNSVQSANGAFDFFAEKNDKKTILFNPQAVPQWFDEYMVHGKYV
jgi:predicted ABC-type ATPase